MNELEKYLTSKEDAGGVSAEDLRQMGKTAAAKYVETKAALNDTIDALAKQAGLNSEQIKRVVEHANNTTFASLFQAGFSTKNIQFPMADANAIIHKTAAKEKTASFSAPAPTKERYIPGQESAVVDDLFYSSEERLAKLAFLDGAKERVHEGLSVDEAIKEAYPNLAEDQLEKVAFVLEDEMSFERREAIKTASVKFLDLNREVENLESEKLGLGDKLTEGLSNLEGLCKQASVQNELFAIGAAIEAANPSDALLSIIKEEVGEYAEFGKMDKLATMGMAIQQNPITGLTSELEGVSQKLVMAQDAVNRTRMAMSELLGILKGPDMASPAAQVFGASAPQPPQAQPPQAQPPQAQPPASPPGPQGPVPGV